MYSIKNLYFDIILINSEVLLLKLIVVSFVPFGTAGVEVPLFVSLGGGKGVQFLVWLFGDYKGLVSFYVGAESVSTVGQES